MFTIIASSLHCSRFRNRKLSDVPSQWSCNWSRSYSSLAHISNISQMVSTTVWKNGQITYLHSRFIHDTYLSTAHGMCINNEIIAHLLWADHLILFSDTFQGLQNQLDGLKELCSNNHMIVNELKTKVVVFGNPKRSKIRFNSMDIDEVTDH